MKKNVPSLINFKYLLSLSFFLVAFLVPLTVAYSDGLTVVVDANRDNGGNPININGTGCQVWTAYYSTCSDCADPVTLVTQNAYGRAYMSGNEQVCKNLCASWQGGGGYTWAHKHMYVYNNPQSIYGLARGGLYQYNYACYATDVERDSISPLHATFYTYCFLPEGATSESNYAYCDL